MKNDMFAMLFLLVVISCISSILCFPPNKDGGQEISMVVDDQITMHDEGSGTNKLGPVQIGKFLLEDGKVLTLARKSSPSRNCVHPEYYPCGAFDWCCEGLYCDGFFNGRCHPLADCSDQGGVCAYGITSCCYPYVCSGQAGHCR